MEILIITNMYPSRVRPEYGTFVKNSAEGLKRCGANVRVCALREMGTSKLLSYLHFFLCAIREGLNGRWDVVYFHYVSLSGIPAIFLSIFSKAKIVAHVHGSDIKPETSVKRKFSAVRLFVSRMACRASDLLIVPSSYYESELINFLGESKKDIFISPSGGVPDFFYEKIEQKKSRLPRILFVGRLVPGKGLSDFLRALELVVDEQERVEVVVVGDGPERVKLDFFCKNNLGSKVNFLHYPSISQCDLFEIYLKTSVFVFPSFREAESLGLVVLEAQAAGVPVVAYRNGALDRIIVDGKNGFLVEKFDISDLARKINILLRLPEHERLSMSCAATQAALPYKNSSISNDLYEKFRNLTGG